MRNSEISTLKQKEAVKTPGNGNSEKGKPGLTLYLIAGPNGSGKSTAYEYLKAEGKIDADTPFVNPDLYGKKLANQYGCHNVNELPPELKTKVDIAAGRQVLTARAKCLKNRQDFIVETTASSRGILKLIDEAKAQGYFIDTSFVILQNAKLNNLRIHSRIQTGGHYVEPEIVNRRFDKAMQLMPEILAKSDCARLIDNTEHYFEVLTKDGKIVKTDPNKNWDQRRLDHVINQMKTHNPALTVKSQGAAE